MVSLKFHDVSSSGVRNLEVNASSYDEETKLELICIKIHNGYDGLYEHVNLDKSTAIKLSKELRKQIALLD